MIYKQTCIHPGLNVSLLQLSLFIRSSDIHKIWKWKWKKYDMSLLHIIIFLIVQVMYGIHEIITYV